MLHQQRTVYRLVVAIRWIWSINLASLIMIRFWKCQTTGRRTAATNSVGSLGISWGMVKGPFDKGKVNGKSWRKSKSNLLEEEHVSFLGKNVMNSREKEREIDPSNERTWELLIPPAWNEKHSRANETFWNASSSSDNGKTSEHFGLLGAMWFWDDGWHRRAL